ncbi:MAG: leishmanolysin-related zinc metalloendopeptidase [Trueperaceae bacterium]
MGSPDLIVEGTATHPIGVASVEANLGTSNVACARSGASFACDVSPLAEGANRITVTATGLDGGSGSATVDVNYVPSEFSMQLVYFDDPFDATHRAAFDEAVAFWETIVIGDLQGATVDFAENDACRQGEPAFSGTIDDLLIFVTGFDDPDSSTLGVAGPCRTRSSGPDEGTNFVGFMEFNAAFLDDLATNGQLVETIVHEIGHVFGFGTNWDMLTSPFDVFEYETDPPGRDCREETVTFTSPPIFTGAEAVAAYARLAFSGSVPVEDEHGPGTRCGHWDEATFGHELMTGFLDVGVHNPLSELSAASLADIGLTVDLNAAEPYDVPFTLGTQEHEHEHEGHFHIAAHEILLAPIGTLDPATGLLSEANFLAPVHRGELTRGEEREHDLDHDHD